MPTIKNQLRATLLRARHEVLNSTIYRGHISDLKKATSGRGYLINFARSGFFSNFFEVLGNIQWCESNDLIPIAFGGKYRNYKFLKNPYWTEKGYNGSSNTWEYFFEPLSGIIVDFSAIPDNFGHSGADSIVTPDGRGIGITRTVEADHIANLELERLGPEAPVDRIHEDIDKYAHSKGYSNRLRMIAYQRDYPSDKYRKSINQLISKWVQLKPDIQNEIDQFYHNHMEGKQVLGVHIRKTDNIGSEHRDYDLDKYFRLVDSIPQDYIIYAATDSAEVLNRLKEVYGSRLIIQNCKRSEDGQAIHKFRNSVGDGDPEIARQVLIDACLLSKTDHFIHGLSGVASAALFLNPNLQHQSIWEC